MVEIPPRELNEPLAARVPASPALRLGPTLLALAATACSPRPAPRSAPDLQASAEQAGAPLPSWKSTTNKRTILEFVERVTKPGTPGFVPPAERIAVFDNDGTLWTEQPLYVQGAFTVDRVKELAPQHPEWKERQPFRGVLEGDATAVAKSGERGIAELVAATHAGNTTEEFDAIVTRWIESARHPRFGRPHTDLVYQPMLELLAFLREKDFEVFIISGGGVEFMRPWAPRVYGVPKERVVGSRIRMKYEDDKGAPVLRRLPDGEFVDDKAGKPVGIQQLIGQRPIAAFGNSDGDFEMLEWTTAGSGPRLGVIIHHTDAEREWAYDRDSHVGKLARALDEAPRRGWTLVDMKSDWEVIYPFQK